MVPKNIKLDSMTIVLERCFSEGLPGEKVVGEMIFWLAWQCYVPPSGLCLFYLASLLCFAAHQPWERI